MFSCDIVSDLPLLLELRSSTIRLSFIFHISYSPILTHDIRNIHVHVYIKAQGVREHLLKQCWPSRTCLESQMTPLLATRISAVSDRPVWEKIHFATPGGHSVKEGIHRPLDRHCHCHLTIWGPVAVKVRHAI